MAAIGTDIPPDWRWVPPPSVSERAPRSVRADALSREQKAAVWAWLKAQSPDSAALLADPDVRELCAAFGAAPVFALSDVNAALRAAGLEPIR